MPRSVLMLLLAAGALAPAACHAPAEQIRTPSPAVSSDAGTAPSAPESGLSVPDLDPQPVSRVVLGGGLVVEDLVIGDGPLCDGPDSTIIVDYRGTLASTGQVFDGTAPGQTAEFPLAKLIRGWKEGVPGMRVGGARRLTVPAAMAYGDRGMKEGDRYVIPPKADLVFEIELLGVR